MSVFFGYDHPSYTVRRTQTVQLPATASATNYVFVPTFPCTITAATISVVVAGTAAANTLAVQAIGTGTSVIGTYAASTAAAASQNTFTVTPTAMAALDRLVVIKGNEATGVAAISFEYLVPQSGTFAA